MFGLGPHYDFFISFSRADSAQYAHTLATGLKEAGLQVFIDRPNIEPGQVFLTPIREALSHSRFFILIASHEALRSQFVELELRQVIDHRRPIVLIDFGVQRIGEYPNKILESGLIRFTESIDALKDGKPSKQIVSSLEQIPGLPFGARLSKALRETVAKIKLHTLAPRRERPNIFISYRTVDSAGYALWLYEVLKSKFWFRKVFLDVAMIEGGDEFDEEIMSWLSQSLVLTALIGKQWLTVTGESGHPRLFEPDDYVRREIAMAFRDGIRVIPVLVDGAQKPQMHELPEDISPLAFRQEVAIRSRHAVGDVGGLIRAVKHAFKR